MPLKKKKRKIADEGKYTLQRKIERYRCSFNQHNIDELVNFTRFLHSWIFFL